MGLKDKINEMLTELQQERDELRVKMALGKAELKDELAELDTKMDELKARAATWADKADDKMDDLLDDAKDKAGDWFGELKDGYKKLRERLTDSEVPPPPAP